MSDTQNEKQVGKTEGGLYNVRLAHPLNERDRVTLGIDTEQSLNVGDIITVTENAAASLITAGLSVAEPTDDARAAVGGATVAGADVEVDPGVSNDQQPGLGTDAINALKGADLDKALADRALPTNGTVDEKRQRLARFVPDPA